MDWEKTTTRRDETHFKFCDLVRLVLKILRSVNIVAADEFAHYIAVPLVAVISNAY